MKYKTQSVLISRTPRKEGAEFKTAVVKLFDINCAHKTTELPKETLEFENIEKVCIKKKHVDYFLEGNDLILNDVGEVTVEQKDSVVEIS